MPSSARTMPCTRYPPEECSRSCGRLHDELLPARALHGLLYVISTQAGRGLAGVPLDLRCLALEEPGDPVRVMPTPQQLQHQELPAAERRRVLCGVNAKFFETGQTTTSTSDIFPRRLCAPVPPGTYTSAS